MPVLSDPELRMIAEVVSELAKYRGTTFDKTSEGTAFARAALIARLVEIHRRLEARRTTDLPRKMLAPLAPLFCDLERHADSVLMGWKHLSPAARGAVLIHAIGRGS